MCIGGSGLIFKTQQSQLALVLISGLKVIVIMPWSVFSFAQVSLRAESR